MSNVQYLTDFLIFNSYLQAFAPSFDHSSWFFSKWRIKLEERSVFTKSTASNAELTLEQAVLSSV